MAARSVAAWRITSPQPMRWGLIVRAPRAASAACVLAAAATVGTACGSSAGSPNTPTPPAGTPSATAAASANKPFGAAITSSTGASYTVRALQAVQARSGASTPDPGGAYFAADVQECAGSGPALTSDPTAWTAVFSGNEEAEGRDASDVATAGPPLATGTVSPGACVAGWVAFTGFADSIPREVHLAGLSSWWTAS